MKLLLSIFGIMLLFNIQNTLKTQKDDSLIGTWELKNFYYYENGEISDTVATTSGYRQLKIFTKNRVMWTRSVPLDSIEWFGYGHYLAKNDELIETLEYGSASMMKIIDTMRIFTFELKVQDSSYSQITLDADGNRFSSENYVRVE